MRDSPKIVVDAPRRARARCRVSRTLAKFVECALRRPRPPSASSSSELSLYVHECPPPRLPIDHPHSAGSLARRWLSTYLSLWGVDWFKGDGEEAGVAPR